jgi:hypothetical protein
LKRGANFEKIGACFLGGPAMPQLHARGVDVVVELLDAADHVGRLTPGETKALLQEAASVLGEFLMRDIPEAHRNGGDPQTDLDLKRTLPNA